MTTDKDVTLRFPGFPPIKVAGPSITEVRPLYIIAREIRNVWAKPYFGAVPYLNAMLTLNDIRDRYALDSASDIVRYFLSNAKTWRGDDARRIKAELKAML